VVLVGLGGAAGSILRYWMSGAVQGLASSPASLGFPVGTLAVNVLGCLMIGALAQLAEQRSLLTPDARALLVVGFLGGFTTFSAFANETVGAWRSGAVLTALLNVALSVALCLAAVVAGRAIVATLAK
jgi:CrcB protein